MQAIHTSRNIVPNRITGGTQSQDSTLIWRRGSTPVTSVVTSCNYVCFAESPPPRHFKKSSAFRLFEASSGSIYWCNVKDNIVYRSGTLWDDPEWVVHYSLVVDRPIREIMGYYRLIN